MAVGTDYSVWMTGSPPTTLRFHLLNAESEDVIKMQIWFKNTQRKDIYKVVYMYSIARECVSVCVCVCVCVKVCACMHECHNYMPL